MAEVKELKAIEEERAKRRKAEAGKANLPTVSERNITLTQCEEKGKTSDKVAQAVSRRLVTTGERVRRWQYCPRLIRLGKLSLTESCSRSGNLPERRFAHPWKYFRRCLPGPGAVPPSHLKTIGQFLPNCSTARCKFCADRYLPMRGWNLRLYAGLRFRGPPVVIRKLPSLTG